MTFKILFVCFYTVAIIGSYAMPYPFTSGSLKRSATVLNKLIMQSLKQLDEPEPRVESDLVRMGKAARREAEAGLILGILQLSDPRHDYGFHMQRREPKTDTGRGMSSRCFFNVVSCFK